MSKSPFLTAALFAVVFAIPASAQDATKKDAAVKPADPESKVVLDSWNDIGRKLIAMLTLLQANSHVYVDVAGLIWSYPIKEVNRYIERLVDAGFEDRVMFGTDQLLWPKLMAYSISIIQNADYLTPEEKRDILYNNAARFLRLDTAQPK